MSNKVYEMITDRVIEQLESGICPWHQPWKSVGGIGQTNLRSKKAYRGVNVFMLGMAPYRNPYWVTYKQAKEFGGQVSKGEHGTPVTFWKRLKVKDKKTGEEKDIPLLRYYTVFNVEQCEGLEGRVPDLEPVELADHEKLAACETIVEGFEGAPDIKSDVGYQACYRPAIDRVEMPHIGQFTKPEGYYSVLFHELTHSTGAEGRLKREGIVNFDRFGSDRYSKEELIAEMGSAFLCGEAGIEIDYENTAAYLQSWCKALKRDPKLIIQAAGAAQKASDLVLGRQPVYQVETKKREGVAA